MSKRSEGGFGRGDRTILADWVGISGVECQISSKSAVD